MAGLRDLVCAQSVGEMSKMGRFNKDFIMYGCAYEEQGEVHYMISSVATNIHDFIDNSVQQGLYPTPIMTITKTCPVPAGTEEDIALSVKVDLAKQLKKAYPKEFFELLKVFTKAPANDGALAILAPIQTMLEGQFVEDKLKLFENLVHLAYQGKVLSQASYQQFQVWLKDMRVQMVDDVVVKESFERTFYGFAYTKAKVG